MAISASQGILQSSHIHESQKNKNSFLSRCLCGLYRLTCEENIPHSTEIGSSAILALHLTHL